MTDTLDNGIKLPAKGSRDWYSDASSNAHLIDEHLGDEDVHLTDDDRTAISSISSKANSSDVYTKTEIDTSLSSKANTSDLTTHTSNSDIHVTSTDKTTWNGKQGALTDAQLNACNSGITSTKVSGYDTHVANSDVHVTTSDKSTWNAKQDSLSTTQLSACNSGITSDKVATYDGYATSKANDSSVVHTSGDETIGGTKTFNIVNSNQYSVLGGEHAQNTPPTNSVYSYLFFYNLAKNLYTSYLENVVNTDGSVRGRWLVRDVNLNITGIELHVKSDGTKTLQPLGGNGIVNLGTSSNKWKTINGINPGALSLPSTNTGYADIKSTVGAYLRDNNTNIYSFTAPFDGWITVGIARGSLRIDNDTKEISNGNEHLSYWISYTIPFSKGDTIIVKINKMSATDDYVTDIMWRARIFPCQGNV